jgi:hypothetical protein
MKDKKYIRARDLVAGLMQEIADKDQTIAGLQDDLRRSRLAREEAVKNVAIVEYRAESAEKAATNWRRQSADANNLLHEVTAERDSLRRRMREIHDYSGGLTEGLAPIERPWLLAELIKFAGAIREGRRSQGFFDNINAYTWEFGEGMWVEIDKFLKYELQDGLGGAINGNFFYGIKAVCIYGNPKNMSARLMIHTETPTPLSRTWVFSHPNGERPL